MDRSVTPINVPAPVVPYAPPTPPTRRTLTPTKHLKKEKKPPTSSSSSADFSSFGAGTHSGSSTATNDYEYDMGYIETDRIDQIDPNAVLYSANSAPYGEQYPSYLPKSMATMVGTMKSQDSSKTFVTGDNVVYGKFPEGAEATKDINIYDDDTADEYYYEDEFEYYDDDYDYYDSKEDDLKELKAQLGVLSDDDNATSETKMSFLQLLQNLQNQ